MAACRSSPNLHGDRESMSCEERTRDAVIGAAAGNSAKRLFEQRQQEHIEDELDLQDRRLANAKVAPSRFHPPRARCTRSALSAAPREPTPCLPRIPLAIFFRRMRFFRSESRFPRPEFHFPLAIPFDDEDGRGAGIRCKGIPPRVAVVGAWRMEALIRRVLAPLSNSAKPDLHRAAPYSTCSFFR